MTEAESSLSEIGREMSRLKRLAVQEVSTNWFGAWSGTQRFATVLVDGGLAFRTEGIPFDRAYFAAVSAWAITKALSGLARDRELVLDLVTRVVSRTPIEAIVAAGFRPIARYERMVNRRPPKGRRRSAAIESAVAADVEALEDRIGLDFDPRRDHLPGRAELAHLVAAGTTLVSRSAKGLSGYLVYDVVGSRSTLRYWFCDDPEAPERAFDLLWGYYEAVERARVMECRAWVDVSKSRVADLHRRCGFEPDGLVDDIFVRTP